MAAPVRAVDGFDCSGLVVAAYAKVGMRLPRTTYEMLDSRALKRQTDHPHPGNLVFFGDGHVTLYYWRHVVLHPSGSHSQLLNFGA